MRRRGILGFLAAVGAALVIAIAAAGTVAKRTGAQPAFTAPAAGETVACRVLEVHTSDHDGMTILIFHQRDKAGGPRLGEMMRVLDGKSVRFEKADAKPHSATLFRLRSCFGRGLLLFPSSSARLEAGDEFELQAPSQ
jgi:hypothetical protein